MNKFLSLWLRRFHRWIAIPTALLIFAAVLIKILGTPEMHAAWETFDQIPSLLMLVMALSGAYLFLLPYISKWQRTRRKTDSEKQG